jgi:hypothetical protein
MDALLVGAGVSEAKKVLLCQPPAKGDQKGVNFSSRTLPKPHTELATERTHVSPTKLDSVSVTEGVQFSSPFLPVLQRIGQPRTWPVTVLSSKLL